MGFTKCFTQWAKLGHINKVSFVGRDIVCFGKGCHLLFIHTQTKEEQIYSATSRADGEGVSCFIGNRSAPVFAFAESCSKPRIFVKTHPDFETVCELPEGTLMGYISLGFSDTSLLISLCDIPDCNIVIWNWRTGGMVKTFKGFIVELHQSIKSSYGYPTHFGQVAIGTCKLSVWDVVRCGKKCITLNHTVKPKGRKECVIFFSSVVWSPEGVLFALDKLGNVYSVSTEYLLEMEIEYTEEGTEETTFTWVKGGLAISGPTQDVRFYKKTNNWECIWIITPPEFLNITSNGKDLLVGVTTHGNVMVLNAENEDFEYIKTSDSRFNDFCLIYPTGEYVATVAQSRFLASWEVRTGEKQDMIELRGEALALAENPEFPYVAVGFKDGVLELFSLYTPEEIKPMVTLQLAKNPINSIYFTEVSKLLVAADVNIGLFFIIEGYPGGTMNIVGTVNIQHQIVDYILIPSRTCYRLFTVLVTNDKYIAGNRLIRFCVLKNQRNPVAKEFELEDPEQLYSALYASQKVNRDRVFWALPFRSKQVHELETKRADNTARVVSIENTGHQMGKILLSFCKNALLTYAFDGLIMIRDLDFEVQHIIMPHHRTEGGVCKAVIDPLNKYIISLGRDNNIVCSVINPNYTDEQKQQELRNILNSERMTLMFRRATKGFLLKGEDDTKTWYEIEAMRNEDRERMLCWEERESIFDEFRSIRFEIQRLLTANLEGPENEKLGIQQFNLDDHWAERLKKHSAAICRHTKLYLEALIVAQDKVTEWCKKYFWDSIAVHGQIIRAISDNCDVSNYVLLPDEYERLELLKSTEEWRKIEQLLSRDDSFKPWLPKTEEELKEHLAQAPALSVDQAAAVLATLDDEVDEGVEDAIDIETIISKAGSSTLKFIEPNPYHYTQCEVQSFLQVELENVINANDIEKLKIHLNKQFDFIKSLKVREMVNIKERYDRLRHIISELNYFSPNKISITLTDPEWCQEEYPEQIMKVEDDEVGVLPYISPSEQEILDQKAAEAERIRLLLLADDFRERALMAMMNGVLEVRWEDELRKEVPVPACINEKDPENYTEEDIKTVKEYEEKVRFLHCERERYMNLLYQEYGKVKNLSNEGMKRFNMRLQDLLILRLELHSAILQNEGHNHRRHVFQRKRIALDDQEKILTEQIKVNEEDIASLNKVLPSAHTFLQEFKTNIETVQAKEKAIDKAFRKDISDFSSVVQEVSSKLYKKRPRVQLRNVNQTSLLLEVSKCLITQEIVPVVHISNESMDFLRAMDTLDSYAGVPTVVDENVYALVCKHRRLKIENEIKSRVAILQLTEAENTLTMFQANLHDKRELSIILQGDLAKVRNDKLNLVKNIQGQIVMRQGLIELPRTGCVEDYDDAVLVCRSVVEDINQIILSAGERKMVAMREQLTYRKDITLTEWHHKKMRMRIEDLREQVKDIDSVKLGAEVMNFLKNRKKSEGAAGRSGLTFEQEVDLMKDSYQSIINEMKGKCRDMQRQINKIKKDSRKVDKEIEDFNVDVCEIKLQLDDALPEKEKKAIRERMTIFLKRSSLVKQIQETHNEIMVYQAELELMRLRTFPTLRYKILF